ncbi:DUF1648 domain-containing protein [Paenibacillus illinoisensis]|uniref:DUF1648 domain-containing protein n=1 Tax=Paenibacillus illinoisensis TaxID=59845 RepID=UPI003A4E3535
MIKFLFDPKTPVMVTALALLAAMTAVWYSPSEIPIHFMNGHADRFVNKWLGLFSSPGIMLLLLGIRKWLDSAVWMIYVLALLQLYMLWVAFI